VRSLTGHDWCDATLYDLSLNTAAIGLDRAVDRIIDLVQPPAAAMLSAPTPRTAGDGP
jgi:hypothetical protein